LIWRKRAQRGAEQAYRALLVVWKKARMSTNAGALLGFPHDNVKAILRRSSAQLRLNTFGRSCIAAFSSRGLVPTSLE